jgi:hypothetical protein
VREVEIPGGTAVLRDRADIRTRDRQLVEAAMIAASSAFRKLPDGLAEAPENATDAEKAKVEEANREVLAKSESLTLEEGLTLGQYKSAVIVAMVQSWTLPEPLPTMATIGDLPADLFDALETAINPLGAAKDALEATEFDPPPRFDKASPTTGSSDSEEPSVEAPSNQLTTRRRSSGASTPTESSIPA